jgi:hypothetical protein
METTGAVARKRAAIREIERSETFRAVRARSRYDDLQVVIPDDGGRYADTIRVRATEDGEDGGVALGLLDRPGDDGDPVPAGFVDAVADRLDRWQDASTADGVVSLQDWGRRPRPWLARDPAGQTIAEWDPSGVAARLRAALGLALSVTTCHRQGVVHAGIDPGNVVFPADSLAEQPRPLLDNVGLMHALRAYCQPAKCLDPRYAAPEYYDDSYGAVDHLTDVYGLGAVCYHVLTDRPPFRGSYADVRAGVLDDAPTDPTTLNASLPAPVDDVLAKALAKDKLVRYENAAQFRSDLERVCDRSGFRVTA